MNKLNKINMNEIEERRKQINDTEVERIFINTIYLKCFKLGMLSIDEYMKRISTFPSET